jgi:hypothetical protein
MTIETIAMQSLECNEVADDEALDVGPEDRVDTMKLSFLDRLLSLWILLAMILGTLTGIYVPSTRNILNNIKIVDVSLPVFLGLLLMLYPVFSKVKYEELSKTIWTRRTLSYVGFSLLITWILCPMIMAALAWSTLPDLPNYRVGVILVGIAPCIAMVLIWNQLAGGDNEFCALLVAVNSVLQTKSNVLGIANIIFFAPGLFLHCHYWRKFARNSRYCDCSEKRFAVSWYSLGYRTHNSHCYPQLFSKISLV